MAKKSKVKKVSKGISYVVILLLIVGIIGFFAYFTNGFQTRFNTFYIKVDDTMYTENSTVTLKPLNDYKFDCKYTFNFTDKDNSKGYNVKVVPNVTDNTNFDYIIGTNYYLYSEIADLTSAFNIQLHDDYFVLNLKTTDMQSILSNVLNDDVKLSDNYIFNKNHFALIVSNHDNTKQIKLTLDTYTSVTGIVLDKESIII